MGGQKPKLSRICSPINARAWVMTQCKSLVQHAMRKACAQSVLPADLPLYGHYVFIEATAAVAHVSKVTEDECPVDIKPTGNDVFTVLPGKAL